MNEIGATLTTAMRQLVPLYEHMGMRIEVDEDGAYRAYLPHGDKTGSHVGTVHAAFQWAIAEVLGGVAVLHVFGGIDELFLVVKRVEIEFVAPARTDLVAHASLDDAARAAIRADFEAKSEVELELDMSVVDDAGTEVARARGVYLIRRRR